MEEHPGWALLTLADPERRNALGREMAAEVAAAVWRLESSGDVRAIVLTGAPPAFCAGADLASLEAADEEVLRALYAGFEAVARSRLLTLAAVNGAAVGAGMNMALACDVRLAAESARFDTRFLSLGLHPGGGHTWLLQRAVSYGRAVALLFGGGAVSGAEAARIGLAHRCVPDDELLEAASGFVALAAAAPRELVTRVKASLRANRDAAYEAALERELLDQLWSVGQPAFAARIAALRRSVSSKEP